MLKCSNYTCMFNEMPIFMCVTMICVFHSDYWYCKVLVKRLHKLSQLLSNYHVKLSLINDRPGDMYLT